MRMMGLGLVLALLTGCAAAALPLLAPRPSVGRGTRTPYAYSKGELRGAYNASLDRTWDATVQSLEALDLQVVDARKEPFGGEIDARFRDGTTARLSLLPKGSDKTLVKIRIGNLGDRDVSKRIGKEIEKRLFR